MLRVRRLIQVIDPIDPRWLLVGRAVQFSFAICWIS